jgi:hypothetical protein
MSHFAEIDDNNMVIRVIVAEIDFINSGVVGDPSRWIQTSYNTFKGKHLLGGEPLRKNFAGIGFYYDKQRDAFIPPKPYDSWIFNEDECSWNAPTPCPGNEAEYIWEETLQEWKMPI